MEKKHEYDQAEHLIAIKKSAQKVVDALKNLKTKNAQKAYNDLIIALRRHTNAALPDLLTIAENTKTHIDNLETLDYEVDHRAIAILNMQIIVEYQFPAPQQSRTKDQIVESSTPTPDDKYEEIENILSGALESFNKNNPTLPLLPGKTIAKLLTREKERLSDVESMRIYIALRAHFNITTKAVSLKQTYGEIWSILDKKAQEHLNKQKRFKNYENNGNWNGKPFVKVALSAVDMNRKVFTNETFKPSQSASDIFGEGGENAFREPLQHLLNDGIIDHYYRCEKYSFGDMHGIDWVIERNGVSYGFDAKSGSVKNHRKNVESTNRYNNCQLSPIWNQGLETAEQELVLIQNVQLLQDILDFTMAQPENVLHV
jgi:hypothetical protein